MDEIRVPPLSSEFSGANLGDARLTKRLMKIADSMAASPGDSFPRQARSAAALEGMYRFVENETVSPLSILEAHIQRTVERGRAHPEILIVHDTTEFEFGGEQHREGLGWLNSENRQGFLAHYSMAVTPTGEPLGTLGLHAWEREGVPKGRRQSHYDPDRESLRWEEGALQTGELMYGATKGIHVMDREGDGYELFSMLLEHDQAFTIRLSHNRRLTAGREAETHKLFEALPEAPFFFERQVPISPRGKRGRSAKKRKTFPERARRMARLEVRAAPMEIFAGNGSVAHVPRSLRLQFIEVREVDAPDGEEPVLWRLVTTEPVQTREQVAKVVDGYCKRWIIEEFFKALKTGCRYQLRQLETAHALLVDLAIETAVAWRLLLLRWLSRREPDAPAERVLRPTQLEALTALMKSRRRPLPPMPTVQDALFAIATLGGHIKNNGPPGWLILRRGFDTLCIAEETWIAVYGERCDQ